MEVTISNNEANTKLPLYRRTKYMEFPPPPPPVLRNIFIEAAKHTQHIPRLHSANDRDQRA